MTSLELNIIREWIDAEAQIKELVKEVRKLREKKTQITEELIRVMSEKNVDCINLLNERKLVHTKNKVKCAISKRSLMLTLSKYFKDEDDATNIIDHIMSTRDEKTVDVIKLKG
jgi:3-methyladenine DNA glycosylase/8-oxoguanine DNA glycosylase